MCGGLGQLKQELERQLKSKIYHLGHDVYSSPVPSFHILEVLNCEGTATLYLTAKVDSDMTYHFLQN
jgi:hypothetical protein